MNERQIEVLSDFIKLDNSIAMVDLHGSGLAPDGLTKINRIINMQDRPAACTDSGYVDLYDLDASHIRTFLETSIKWDMYKGMCNIS